jgi:hypothetical protein
VVLQRFAQGGGVLQGALAQGPPDDEAQALDVEGLGEEVVGPQAHGPHRLLDAAGAGEDDHRHRQPPLPHHLEQLHAADAGQAQVGQDQAVGVLDEGRQGLGGVADGLDVQAGVG